MTALSVIVMAYNEAESLERVVDEVETALRVVDRPYEIIIVNDGSGDGTGDVADRLSSVIDAVRVVHHEVNRGLGEVYRTGFAAARGEFVTIIPADGQFPAAFIPEFLGRIENAAAPSAVIDWRR